MPPESHASPTVETNPLDALLHQAIENSDDDLVTEWVRGLLERGETCSSTPATKPEAAAIPPQQVGSGSRPRS